MSYFCDIYQGRNHMKENWRAVTSFLEIGFFSEKVKWDVKQEVGDYIRVSVLNIVPKVSTLPHLMTISLVKMERQNFQILTWTLVVNTIKKIFGYTGGSYLIGLCDLMLIQPWNKVMCCSLISLKLHIRVRTSIPHLSIPGIVAHVRCYMSHCF